MTTQNTLAGYERMREAIASEQDLGALVTRLSKASNTSVGAELFGGAISALVEAFFAMKAAGLSVSSHKREVNECLSATKAQVAVDLMLAVNSGDSKAASMQLSALCGALTAARGKLRWRVASK